ncbi:MAG: RNA polymerase sigma factor [Bacteroidales bacterium]|nr:RNA polymerase sigma factor [Bacteroidales bacterium]MCF8344854.1 RNA polymerase sigma factor [Bacteroidales bacterium]MCF8350814.1 RNA polymerase sigma factor [Bacteroidales bacterium]MCF8374799.1 RNA polymerase sigma factor [Bacteroidales bacterium]MCF8399797.1 RNA polymerase sigma factor [Bacteroidales bacterium]
MTTSEYNKCVDEHADGVYRFILKNIRRQDKAEDIVQDTFVKMWDRHREVSHEKAKSYLFTAAYHTMIDYIRKDKRNTDFEEAPQDILTNENRYSDLSEVLEEALAKLPEVQRSVIMLRDYEGYSYKEVGEITRLNESQVKVYIYRARKFLKDYIVSLDKVI